MSIIDPITASQQLCDALDRLSFGPPVTHVYNPLRYAAANNAEYLQRYGKPPKQAVFLGMNPGPWGMAQSGVPFGDTTMVRDFLRIDRPVQRPPIEHPKRPVQGLDCPRSEVSGSRLWGAIREHFEQPQRFFERFFVANYCPLSFMEQSGRNRTPNHLPAEERGPLFAACDEYLRQLVDYLQPRWVIGIGAFAEQRAREALAGRELQVGRVLHPSPASPAANKNWLGKVREQLRELGVCNDNRSGLRASIKQSCG